MTDASALWLFVALVAVAIYLSWVKAVLYRWWRRLWGRFKYRVARAPIDFPVWLWRRFCLLFVPGWLSERDFYLTPEWKKAAVENKRRYGWKCVVCDVTNAELPGNAALHSHHVKKRLRAPWLALRQSNLCPLCPTCHQLVEHGKIKLRWDGKRWGIAG